MEKEQGSGQEQESVSGDFRKMKSSLTEEKQ